VSEADDILYALCTRGIDYRCLEQPGEWVAGCPLCGVPANFAPRTVLEIGSQLRIAETRGGRVLLHCKAGHDPAEIRSVLLRPDWCWHCGATHGEVETLRARIAFLEFERDQAYRVIAALR
jgi:hypothetical protein